MTAATLTTTELTARVTAIKFLADDGSYVIATARVTGGPDDGAEVGVKGAADPDAALAPGLVLRFAGTWHQHERHGRQFQFTSYAKIVPHDQRGVIAYLVNTVDGVGERTALKLWDAFGPEAVQVLREDPARVVAAGVLSEERAKEASRELHNEAAFESVKIDLLALFRGRGFQATKLIRACLREWGERAPELIRRNPYLLMIKGLPSAGFKRCDKLYLDRGGRPHKLKRQMLCAWYALKTESSGHTWHRQAFAVDAIEKAMPPGKAKPQKAISLGVRSGWLAIRETKHAAAGPSDRHIAERGKARAEEAVARELLRLTRGG